ncbi:MAG: NfeD family protein [Methylobacterium mesophilicum]|nr:NfeD family protein [Methylobacterium mesophilicum]
MLTTTLISLGAWNWIVLGLVLLAFEVFLPGVFLLWIGIAALLTGALSLQLADWAGWTWHWQVLVFLGLALLAVWAGRRLMGAPDQPSDQPLLNRRSEQLVGRAATLTEPIVDGRGRIALGDTLWRVSGPDLPAGTRVKVTAVEGMELVVTRTEG